MFKILKINFYNWKSIVWLIIGRSRATIAQNLADNMVLDKTWHTYSCVHGVGKFMNRGVFLKDFL